MSPRTANQNITIRKEKHDRILDAALEVFGLQGYHSSSMAGIAQKAGVSKGLIYSYFENKDDLIISVVKNGLKLFESNLQKMEKMGLNDETYLAMIDASIESIEQNPNYWKMYYGLFFHQDIMQQIKPFIDELMGKYMGIVLTYFEKKGSKDPYNDAFLAGSALDGITFGSLLMPDKINIRQLKYGFVTKVLANIIPLDEKILNSWKIKNNFTEKQKF